MGKKVSESVKVLSFIVNDSWQLPVIHCQLIPATRIICLNSFDQTVLSPDLSVISTSFHSHTEGILMVIPSNSNFNVECIPRFELFPLPFDRDLPSV